MAKNTTVRPPRRYAFISHRCGATTRSTFLGPIADPVVQTLLAARELELADREAARHAADQAIQAYERFERLIRFVSTNTARLQRQDRERQRQLRLGLRRDRPMTAPATTPTADITRDDFDEAVERAAEGDAEALAVLRRMLLRNREAAALLGDVAGFVREHLIDLLGAHAVEVREAVRGQMEVLERDLLAEGDGPLERLLVDQVVASLLDVSLRQLEKERDGIGATRRRRFERAVDRAQQRHLRAVGALQAFRSAGGTE